MAQDTPHIADDISRGVGLIHLRLRLQLQSILRVILITSIGFVLAPILVLWFRAEPHAFSGALWWKLASVLQDGGAGGHVLHPMGDPRFWTADSIVGNIWFTAQATAIQHLFWLGVMYGFAAIPFLVLGVIFIAGLVGGRARTPHKLRGRSLVRDTALADILIRGGVASDLAIGKVPLISGKETEHILLAGSTGTGKTQTIYGLLDAVRKRGDLAIVYDKSGSFLPIYYRPDLGDQILNPLDRRSATWSPWAEINDPTSAETMAESIIPGVSGQNKIFADAARVVFSTGLTLLETSPSRTVLELFRHLIIASRAAKEKLFAKTEIVKFYDRDAGRTAASVDFNAATYVRSLRFLKASAGRGDFSIAGFVSSADRAIGSTVPRPWLFITAKGKQIKALRPLITCQIDSAIDAALALPENRQRRIWLFLDELDSLNQMPSLVDALKEGRKYGVCVVAGLQDFSQLYDVWGERRGQTLLSLFNTTAIYRLNNAASAREASDMLGEVERELTEESARYGAHADFESLNLGTRREVVQLVLRAEVGTLPDLSCYVKLPGDYPIAMTTLPNPALNVRPKRHAEFEPGDYATTVAAHLRAEHIDLGIEPDEAEAEVAAGTDPPHDPETGEILPVDSPNAQTRIMAPSLDGTDTFQL